MSLKHTLLGFLTYGPRTGYDLKKEMDHSTQFFWYAALSQIYPTLKQMEDDGWVESRSEAQEGRPDRVVYYATEPGQAAFLEWLQEPVGELPRYKDAAVLKLFFAGQLDKDAILHHLRIQLDLHRARLRQYKDEIGPYVEQVIESSQQAREGVMWRLVQGLGERYEQTSVAWLEDAIAAVQAEM